ncbi:MAG: hypothetical protein ACUZ8E_18020 [Candidatus Anammoxibacter sp.]
MNKYDELADQLETLTINVIFMDSRLRQANINHTEALETIIESLRFKANDQFTRNLITATGGEL